MQALKTFHQFLSEKEAGKKSEKETQIEDEVNKDEETDLVKKSARIAANSAEKIEKEIEVDKEEIADEGLTKEAKDLKNYMFFENLENMKMKIESLLSEDYTKMDMIIDGGHDWASDHIAAAMENITQVTDFMLNELKEKGTGVVPSDDTKKMLTDEN